MASPSLACTASMGFPTCAVCACVLLQLPSTPLLPPPGLRFPPPHSVDTKGHPALAGPQGLLHVPLLHAKMARRLFFSSSCSSFKSPSLNVSWSCPSVPTLAASDPPFRTASRQTCHWKGSQGNGVSALALRTVTYLPSHTAVSWMNI